MQKTYVSEFLGGTLDSITETRTAAVEGKREQKQGQQHVELDSLKARQTHAMSWLAAIPSQHPASLFLLCQVPTVYEVLQEQKKAASINGRRPASHSAQS